MLFSFKIIDNIIILIPAIDYKTPESSGGSDEFEAAFFDIFALTACAMNLEVITEAHDKTFSQSALSPFWIKYINDEEFIGFPKILKHKKLEHFAYRRETLGKLIKLKRFAGLNIVLGVKFKTNKEQEREMWKDFLTFGSLRVSKANFFTYCLSSAEDSAKGGCELTIDHITPDVLECSTLHTKIKTKYEKHLGMRDRGILEYRLTDIEIGDLESTKEILDYKELATECCKNLDIAAIIKERTEVITQGEEHKSPFNLNNNQKGIEYKYDNIRKYSTQEFEEMRPLYLTGKFAKADYGFYYNLYFINPMYHHAYNCIATFGEYPPQYYPIIAFFLNQNGQTVDNVQFKIERVFDAWNDFLSNTKINKDKLEDISRNFTRYLSNQELENFKTTSDKMLNLSAKQRIMVDSMRKISNK
jgi:hypothetical protein